MKVRDIKFDIGDVVYWKESRVDGVFCSGIVKSISFNVDGIIYNIKKSEYGDITIIDQSVLIDKREVPCLIIQRRMDEVKDRIKILCEHLKELREDYKEAKKIELIQRIAGI